MPEENSVAPSHKRRGMASELFVEEVVGQVGRAYTSLFIRIAAQAYGSNFGAQGKSPGDVEFSAKTNGRSRYPRPCANENIS